MNDFQMYVYLISLQGSYQMKWVPHDIDFSRYAKFDLINNK